MSNEPSSIPPLNPFEAVSKSRGWFIFGGIISLIVGFLAIVLPIEFSFIITQLIGALLLISGVVSIFLAIFGKHQHHRVLSALSGVLRIIAGLALLVFVAKGVWILTLILAIFLIIEGIVVIFTSTKMRGHQGWVWTLINGCAALLLGVIVYAHVAMAHISHFDWILGTLYGINSIFSGTSLLMLGLSAPKPE